MLQDSQMFVIYEDEDRLMSYGLVMLLVQQH